MKIAAVVVTFNRLSMLKQCIESLRNQSRKVDEIIVVNNSSDDGTFDWLNDQSDLIVITQENSGSAGGQYTGLKFAYERGFEWIWTMDDDIIADIFALEKLLEYSHLSHCLHPLKKDNNGTEIYWENIFHPGYGKIFFYPNTSFKNGKEWCSVNTGCFEGMLIHRDLISKIGFPEKKYFIDQDDLMYGFMCSLYTNVLYIKNSIVTKQVLSENFTPRRAYYRFRNFFLMRKQLISLGFWKKLGDVLFIIYLFQEIFRSMKEINFEKVKGIILGVFDGLRGRFYKGRF